MKKAKVPNSVFQNVRTYKSQKKGDAVFSHTLITSHNKPSENWHSDPSLPLR